MVKRAKGFAPWKPHKKTEALLRDIEAVLEEYRAYWPLTVRQLFYRLVAERGYPKTERFYKNSVDDFCTRGRRCGRIPFEAIRDDGVSRQGGETIGYESPEQYYETHEEISNFYSRSWHDDQSVFVQVLCEAAGMVPMLARAVRPYRVGVASSSGFDSLTVKHELFTEAARRYEEFDQETILLHLGDHDPSGVSIHESMSEDLSAFCADWDLEGIIELRRVALTPEQIPRLRITTRPEDVKPSDSRSRTFLERGLDPAAQLEAIPPNTLSEIVAVAVEDALDMDALRATQERERRERAEVQEKLDQVNEVLRDAFGL